MYRGVHCRRSEKGVAGRSSQMVHWDTSTHCLERLPQDYPRCAVVERSSRRLETGGGIPRNNFTVQCRLQGNLPSNPEEIAAA